MAAYPWYSVFVRRGHLLALVITMLIAAGISALINLPRLEDPRLQTRLAFAITPYPGASAERVEALVTDVLEDELRELHEIKKLTSTSRAGISVLVIELQDWVDNTTNQQAFSRIRDTLRRASQDFPAGAGVPFLDDKRSVSAFTLILGVKANAPASDSARLLEARLAAELIDRLRAVHGTELVRSYGAVKEEISVVVRQHDLALAGLSVSDVAAQVRAYDPKIPAGKFLSRELETRLQINHPLASLEEVSNIPLFSDKSGVLRLGDIADVQRSWQTPRHSVALVDGLEQVLVAARMDNTVRVDNWTQQSLAVVERFNQEYAGSVSAAVVFEQDAYTRARLTDLTVNLLIGCAAVVAVVLVFMGIHSALIVGLALPLCVSFTLFALQVAGQQLHQMSIFGMIVAIGLLIDNAIVITDDVRVQLGNDQLSRIDAYLRAIQHLAIPLFASTLTTILGFMPVFLLSGNIGDFVSPIAISVLLALIGSYVISLTIIAPLAARYLPRHYARSDAWYQTGIAGRSVAAAAHKLLARCLLRPRRTALWCLLPPLLGFALVTRLDNVFFPTSDRDQFEIMVQLPAGSALTGTRDLVESIDVRLRAREGVAETAWLIGGSIPPFYYNQLMNQDNKPNYAHGVVITRSARDATRLTSLLQHELAEQYPQAMVIVRAFGQGPPIAAPVALEVIGPDLHVLSELGDSVRLAMTQVAGVSNTRASINIDDAELLFDSGSEALSRAGTSPSQVALQVFDMVSGQLSGSVVEETEDVPIRVIGDSQLRGNTARLGDLAVLSPVLRQQQQYMPLLAAGDWEMAPVASSIQRINGERVNLLEAWLLPGFAPLTAVQAVQDRLAAMDFQLPDGYRLRVAGDADQQDQAQRQLAAYVPLLLIAMIATLVLSFFSTRYAAIILSVALLSVGLGMLSLWLSGISMGFTPIIGFMGLMGVTINGSIVVIAAIQSSAHARAGDIDAITSATMSCSRHILSTSVTTVMGFVPLLLFTDSTMWPPLAVVIAGGVGFSVFLSLLFTPVMVRAMGCSRTPLLK